MVPSHAVVTSSARSSEERKNYQLFLTRAVQLYSSKPVANYTGNDRRYDGVNRFDTKSEDKYYDQKSTQNQNQESFGYNNQFGSNIGRGFNNFDLATNDNGFTTERSTLDQNGTKLFEKFDLFESERYGGRLNLMFQDAARNLVAIKEEDQSFAGYLGPSLAQILEVRHCPVNRMTMCVTSDAELEKCVKMRVSAFERSALSNRFISLNFSISDSVEGSIDQTGNELLQRTFAHQLHAGNSNWHRRCDRAGCQ